MVALRMEIHHAQLADAVKDKKKTERRRKKNSKETKTVERNTAFEEKSILESFILSFKLKTITSFLSFFTI